MHVRAVSTLCVIDCVSAPMENKQSNGQPGAAADLEQGLTQTLIEYYQSYGQPETAGYGAGRVGSVPPHVRGTDVDGAYAPRFISMGPIHHANRTLRQHSHSLKVAYLHALIARRPGPVDDVGVRAALLNYKTGVAEHEEEARAFYAEPVVLGYEEFVDMLVLDGCFLLEHMLNCAMGVEEPRLHSTHWAPSQLHADLIRFENQIPFFILAVLLARSPLCPDFEACRAERHDFLRSLGVHYLLRKDDQELKGLKRSEEVYHVLHLYSLTLTAARLVRPHAHAWWGTKVGRVLWRFPIIVLTPVAYLLCAGGDDEEGEEGAVKLPNLPSATDLQRVGIKFKRAPRRPDGGFLDVRLEDGDTLVIPMVNIEQFTAPQLQNLIALEQATPELPDDCSCYAFFMDNLVANPADVALLEAEGILKSNLGSHKAVVTYFNKLCRGNKLELEGNYLGSVFEALMARNKNPMYAWIRTFKKKYFSSPWGLIAMIVTLFVFASTVLQTYITLMQYYASSKLLH